MSPKEEYDGNGGWKEWSQYVKLGIQDLKNDVASVKKDITDLKIELGMLKTKMAMWGAVGATIATLVVQLIMAYVKIKGGAP